MITGTEHTGPVLRDHPSSFAPTDHTRGTGRGPPPWRLSRVDGWVARARSAQLARGVRYLVVAREAMQRLAEKLRGVVQAEVYELCSRTLNPMFAWRHLALHAAAHALCDHVSDPY